MDDRHSERMDVLSVAMAVAMFAILIAMVAGIDRI
jgi:hypothetical protein